MRKGKNKEVKASVMKAAVTLGKSGVTEGWISELRRRLKSEGVIKVRVSKALIRSGTDVAELARKISALVEADVVDVRGHTFTLVKHDIRRSR
jgi:RNA-binding protein YhbY